MTKIMLVRHGLTAWNGIGKMQGSSDVHLSPDGLHQARLLAAHCPFVTADAVYSSPLARAETTALVLANKFNLHVQTVDDLREISFGDWEEQLLRDIAKIDPINFEKFFKAPDELKIPNAETFSETQERAVNALKKILEIHKDEKESHIIIVAHGVINRVILSEILGMPLKKIWTLSQFNTAVNIIREDDGLFTVDLINSTAHLL
ncbi:MAG: histidine phosphatase family protein [Selenomonadaceae bacterium]|nr:histidine phosphatase family protein [Selenomonadaceae bacterium]